MPILSTLLHSTAFSRPFLSTLVPSIALAFALQGAVAVPSALLQTERFFDISGSLTYLSCAALSLYLPSIRARHAATLAGTTRPDWPSLLGALKGAGNAGLNWRQVVLSAAVGVWASRCESFVPACVGEGLMWGHKVGSYLFRRITSDDGRDSRFDEIRQSPGKMAGMFLGQAMWVSLCLLPVLSINALPLSTFSALPAAVGVTDVLGLLLYVGGLSFEVIADRQKNQWVQDKKQKKHDEDFLTRGLWGKSRHPNYFGESTLWTGIATLSAGVLLSGPGQVGLGLAGYGVLGQAIAAGMCAVSPGFVSFLLLKVSGIPPSEEKYDKRYGDRKDYQKWKRDVPMFFPKP